MFHIASSSSVPVNSVFPHFSYSSVYTVVVIPVPVESVASPSVDDALVAIVSFRSVTFVFVVHHSNVKPHTLAPVLAMLYIVRSMMQWFLGATSSLTLIRVIVVIVAYSYPVIGPAIVPSFPYSHHNLPVPSSS